MNSVIDCRAPGWHLAELHDRLRRSNVAQYLLKGNSANDLMYPYLKWNLTDYTISCTIGFITGNKG